MSDEVDAKIATHLGRMRPDAVGRLRARGSKGDLRRTLPPF